MKRSVLIVFLATSAILYAVEHSRPTLFIEPEDGFETYLAAAITKKNVAADVVMDKEKAMYLLKPSSVTTNKESTGGKVARCLFLYCAGIEDRGNVSVQLIDVGSSKVVWAYAVNKQRGHKNEQSMAEAVANHLNDYFKSWHAAPTTASANEKDNIQQTSNGATAVAPPVAPPAASFSNANVNSQAANTKVDAHPQTEPGASSRLEASPAAGTISVTSTPTGAEIFLDSVGSGKAPALIKVSPGKHLVQVTKSGYKDWTSEVVIVPGGIVNVTATLEGVDKLSGTDK